MNETFGQALRRLRSSRGITQKQLAKQVWKVGGYISELELGKKPPNRWIAADLDETLGGNGLLIELAAAQHAATQIPRLPGWDDSARQVGGVTQATPPSSATVDYLTRALALQRSAEDTAGSRVVLTPTLGQLVTVETLRDDADGDLHRDLLSLESQYAQFLGWCYQDLGEIGSSEQWYARALMLAHEAGDQNMIASILSMRSNAAWGRGDIRRAVNLGEAATRPAATPGVLALSQQQAARGYAAAGDRSAAERALGLAVELSGEARKIPDREPPWIYFVDESRIDIQRAIALHELGDHARAAELFSTAIARLPVAYRRDRGIYLARMGAALIGARERGEAAVVVAEARGLAEETGSVRAMREVNKAERLLAA